MKKKKRRMTKKMMMKKMMKMNLNLNRPTKVGQLVLIT